MGRFFTAILPRDDSVGSSSALFIEEEYPEDDSLMVKTYGEISNIFCSWENCYDIIVSDKMVNTLSFLTSIGCESCFENTLEIKEEIAPLVIPDEDDAKALRFDALIYGIELAYLVGKKYSKARNDLIKKVNALANTANIPEIMSQHDLINRILHTDYVETAGINE